MCFAPQRRALFRHLNFQNWSKRAVFLAFSLANRRALFGHLNFQKCSKAAMFCTFWLGNVLRATTACTFSTSQLQKVLRTCSVFSFFTCKCASHHKGVHFFDISTFKSGPTLVCFVHFDSEMCFAPRRRAIFFISHLASWLRTRRYSEPTFRPSGATIHWKKHSDSRLFYLFAHLHLLPSDSFSSLIFFLLLFSSLLFSDSSHLCFFICPYCRKFDF